MKFGGLDEVTLLLAFGVRAVTSHNAMWKTVSINYAQTMVIGLPVAVLRWMDLTFCPFFLRSDTKKLIAVKMTN